MPFPSVVYGLAWKIGNACKTIKMKKKKKKMKLQNFAAVIEVSEG